MSFMQRPQYESRLSRRWTLTLLSVVVLSLNFEPRSWADSLTAVDAGFVTAAGGSAKGDGALVPGATFNYSVGLELHYAMGAYGPDLAPLDRKNYFVFDLSGVSDTIVSASLEIYTGIYESVDPTETFDLVAPLDPAAAMADAGMLLMSNLIGPSEFDAPSDMAIMVAAAMYGNLAGGPPPFSSAIISAADDGTILSIPLGAAGLDYLNAFLGGPVILGGSVPTAIPPTTPQQPFGFTGPDIPGGDVLTPTLVFEVIPEPGTLALAALALGMAVFRRCGRSA